MPTINGVEQKVMGQFVISPPQWDGSLLQSCCALVSVTWTQMAKVRVVAGMKFSEKVLTNSQIAELLAIAAEDEPAPLDPAYRRAFRKALIWPVEFIPCGPASPYQNSPLQVRAKPKTRSRAERT